MTIAVKMVLNSNTINLWQTGFNSSPSCMYPCRSGFITGGFIFAILHEWTPSLFKQEDHDGPISLTCVLSSKGRQTYIPTCDPRGGASFKPRHKMNKLGRGPLGDATYKVSKL